MKISQIKSSRFAGKDAGATVLRLAPYRALRSAGFQPASSVRLPVRTEQNT